MPLNGNTRSPINGAGADAATIAVAPKLVELAGELAALAERLDERRYVAEPTGAARSDPRDHASDDPAEILLTLALRAIQHRTLRNRQFRPALFADPAWDMLLDLFVSRLRHHPVCVSSLCIAARVPPTTALRWIRNMEVHGELVRRRDPHDGRRVFMEISDAAFDAVARTLQPSCEERSSVNAGSGLSG